MQDLARRSVLPSAPESARLSARPSAQASEPQRSEIVGSALHASLNAPMGGTSKFSLNLSTSMIVLVIAFLTPERVIHWICPETRNGFLSLSAHALPNNARR